VTQLYIAMKIVMIIFCLFPIIHYMLTSKLYFLQK